MKPTPGACMALRKIDGMPIMSPLSQGPGTWRRKPGRSRVIEKDESDPVAQKNDATAW